VIWWPKGFIYTTNAVGITHWLWLATWFLQVMPLFFFVGGFSNLKTYDSARRGGEPTHTWVKTRMMRLIKPSMVFLGVWAVIQVAMHLFNIGTEHVFLRGMLPPGATVPFGPLWFLPVYLYVIALAPWMIRLHRRFGVRVPVALVAVAIAVDATAFIGNMHGLRYLNVFIVWLIPHQIGFFYADGRLVRLSKRALWLMALGGLAGLILLTNPPIFFGHGSQFFDGIRSYPKSLIGTEAERVANTYPPTIVMVAASFWVIGLALLLRERLTRWLRRAGPWMFTIYINSVIMTLYLWHMTAYLLAILLLWPLGLGQEHATNAAWWLQRIVWEVVPGVILFGLIQIFGKFERVKPATKQLASASPSGEA
jgi:hypothetical protein